MSLVQQFSEYNKISQELSDLNERNAKRVSLLKLAKFFQIILLQQNSLESLSSKHSKTEPGEGVRENGKAKSSAKEVNSIELNQQISKLNQQLTQTKIELDMLKQNLINQKTQYEKKLESAKVTIKSLREKQYVSPSRASPSNFSSSIPVRKQSLVAKSNTSNNFSTSPFLKRLNKTKSPSKNLSFMSPTINSMNKSKIIASSTPSMFNEVSKSNDTDLLSPSKSQKPTTSFNAHSPKRSSNLSKVVTFNKKSLFDFDDEKDDVNENDESLFNNSFKRLDDSGPNSLKIKKIKELTNSLNMSVISTTNKKKRKLANINGVNLDEAETLDIVTPIKKAKGNNSMYQSPLRSTKKRNIFKI